MKMNISIIQKRRKYLEELVDVKTKELQKLPEGSIRAVEHGHNFQYYLRSNGYDKNGRYIKKSNQDIASRMIQHEYDQKVIDSASREIDTLTALEKIYAGTTAEDIYLQMPKGKQALSTPIEESDEEFLARFLNLDYPKLSFADDAPEFYTNSDIRVRSKSEVIIANLLDKMKVPYLYEMPLVLKGFTVHPDFTLIDVENRRLIYHEHLGMLDDSIYVNNALMKIREYEKCGYYLGETLLITGESSTCPLDIKLVEKKIRYILSSISV